MPGLQLGDIDLVIEKAASSPMIMMRLSRSSAARVGMSGTGAAALTCLQAASSPRRAVNSTIRRWLLSDHPAIG